MSRLFSIKPQSRKRFLVGFCALVFVSLVIAGVFAKNDWYPKGPDPFTGKRTGWFGKQLPKNASSSWNPYAAPLPDPTPQLSRELIYAGSRLLVSQDANANAAPPADLAVWRPSTGVWWVMGGQGSQQVQSAWGMQGDEPVPGDYDGDGKTDFSVFRPGQSSSDPGVWYVLRSSDGAWDPVISWGMGSDKRVPADYDGDGKTDRAVWRASDGTWYVVLSSNFSSVYYYYGSSGDLPAPADYDGDGKADVGLWRNSNKTFYSINSSNNAPQAISTNIEATGSYVWFAVASDYDGDGRADYAIYDQTASNWYIRSSASGNAISPTQWGNGGDIPVQNDYDGDGKCDLAVWRPTNNPGGTLGKWYIQQSAHSLTQRTEQWGILGDIPVPAFYRR